ncbi:hypothetical protein CYQ91_23060 [Vibrio diabolicus]|uniref:DUF3265 domain-containing protein n=1 Tax=Vibrio diabolicus TaxID=50719 RepID=A0AAX1XGU6_9VIBR|nr:hypothetical protein CYQ91_23060 [Vibrio diabolicus]
MNPCQNKHNKAFKSDSQRLAVSLRSSIAKRRSHLNAALCLLVFQWLKNSSICVLCPFGHSSELPQQIRIVGISS